MAAQSTSRDRYLQALGIERWQLRGTPRDAAEAAASSAAPATPIAGFRNPGAAPGNPATADWDTLAGCVANCTKCNLHGGRTRTVFGVGNRKAEWMVIGEAPGAEEDASGEPFVGRAGQLLNAMLQAIGLRREQVYIANILKCRPPQNRDPLPEEVQQCWPYLKRQIELVAPRIILAVGRIAAQNLLLTDQAIGRLRGKVHIQAETGIPMVVTYHPAYLLRSPSEKRKAWEDLLLARRAREQAGP